ncbi:MAG TPA: M56 family metallopeptidase [Candidatus Krumholzibacteria bacterium]|nr:M56 family metallopeptidase [Candidatus Krumholzibacteria bacterium]
MSVLKATLLIGAALLLIAVLRRRSASLRHAILLAAVAGSLAVPFLASTLPTVTPPGINGGTLPAAPELRRLTDNATRLVMTRTVDEANSLPQSNLRRSIESRDTAILAVWLAGTTFMMLRIIYGLTAAHALRRRARLRGRLRSGVPLLESDEVDSPVVVDVVHPAIMLPAGLHLDAAALRPVIAHEMAHIERRDCLTQLIVRAACAIYWFNPLVWVAARRIALECEGACDDRALAAGADPIEYSEILIGAARMCAYPLRAHAASLMHVPHLEERIVRILDASTRRGGLSGAQLVGLVLGAVAIVTPLAALGVHDRSSTSDLSDSLSDPQSERVPGIRREVPEISLDGNASEAEFIRALQVAASREPVGEHDLVPDRARWALSLVSAGSIMEPLMEALHNSDWRVRAYAAWALGASGDAGAVEALLPLLDDSVWRVRAMAAASLREIGNASAIASMEKALDDPAWQVRAEAVAFLGELGAEELASRILDLTHDPHIAVRLAADEALTKLK